MATRKKAGKSAGKAAATDPMKEVRAAWKHAHSAWGHVESSLAELVEAEAALMRSLKVAGTVWTKKARSEAESALKQLQRKRAAAMKQVEKIAQRYDFMKKPLDAAKKAAGAASKKVAAKPKSKPAPAAAAEPATESAG
jgi:hypothetical protein